MTTIKNYQEEVKRFEDLLKNRVDSLNHLPQLVMEKPVSNDMVHAATNSLRSPLVALKIYLDLLKNFPQEEKKSDVLSRMKITTNEMVRKINALSTLVDVQNQPLEETEPIYFKEILEDVNQQLGNRLDHKDIMISTQFEIPAIQANRTEMTLLLLHIIQNCIDFRKDNQPLHIALKTKKIGGYYLLGVKDNGIGMMLKNDNESDKLFLPFFKVNPKNKGIGIGLSIVKSIVDKYEGEIKVRSRINEGAMFNIYLKS